MTNSDATERDAYVEEILEKMTIQQKTILLERLKDLVQNQQRADNSNSDRRLNKSIISVSSSLLCAMGCFFIFSASIDSSPSR